MKILDVLKRGSIITCVNFLEKEVWQELHFKKNIFKY